MDGPSFSVSILVDSIAYAKTLIDTGCSLYGIINSHFVKKHNLKRIKLETPQPITGYEGREGAIDEVVYIAIDIDSYYEAKVFLYIIPYIEGEDIILGIP
jgi:hypothetical protein